VYAKIEKQVFAQMDLDGTKASNLTFPTSKKALRAVQPNPSCSI
jgi:hypothetical protein